MGELVRYFSEKINALHSLGVCDVVVDPGFGFAKTTEQNFELLARLHELQMFELPLLVGVSRKSMVCRTLNVQPDRALNGTTALHMAALERGACILRVHDVRAAREVVGLFENLRSLSTNYTN
jgi:dihydropteroate synthase